MFIIGIPLFFFLLFIILIPPREPVIGDLWTKPSNPPKGQITFSFLETFALFKVHNNYSDMIRKIKHIILEWIVIKTIPIWFKLKRAPRMWFID